MTKDEMVAHMLTFQRNLKIDALPLKEYAAQVSEQELRAVYEPFMDECVVKKARSLWMSGEMQGAYDYFLQYEETFQHKISLAVELIKNRPTCEVKFFGDTYPLADIDPIELCICYTKAQIIALCNKFSLDIAPANEDEYVEQYSEERLRLAKDIKNFANKYEVLSVKVPHIIHLYELEAHQLAAQLTLQELQQLYNALIEQTWHLLEDEDLHLLEEQKEKFIDFDTGVELELVGIEQVVEQIFLTALEKGIKVIHEPIAIDFQLDDVDDIVANYRYSDIQKALAYVQSFDSAIKKGEQAVNTLEIARKYINGKIEEEVEDDWRSYAPSYVKKQIEHLELREAYDIVLQVSKQKDLAESTRKKIMDYRFDLEELIFGERASIVESIVVEEFKEYPFEEYVRHTVEAIILPHLEVLEKIEKEKGKIQFQDIWSQHFSDSLKQKVRERDGHKCVICDEETNLHVHHKIPRKFGGVNHIDNLVTLCASCHGAVETADFEHAYHKCMGNAIKAKTSLQKPVDTSKEIYLLKEEVKEELERIYYKINARDETLGSELLAAMKKVDTIFDHK